MKYIKNLEDQILTEGVAEDAAEISGLDADAVNDAVAGLNFASYLELGNAVTNEDGELIRELLNISDVVPEEPIEEDQPDGSESHDPTEECYACSGRRTDPWGQTCITCGGNGRTLNGEWYDEDELYEADNPSAPATAAPAQTAAAAPSAGSSIDALAQPADTAADEDNQEVQQGRKEVDDLAIGDEIEVADIDGQPAAGRVRNLAGPGDTLVITGKGNEEHMIRKDSILSTPMIPVQEKKQSRLDRTWLGKKNKRAERVEDKKKKDVQEDGDGGTQIQRIEDGGAGRRSWQMRFEVGPLETMSHQDRSWQVSEALKGLLKGNRKLQRELKNRMGAWGFEKMPTEEDRNGIIYIPMRNDNVEENLHNRDIKQKRQLKVGSTVEDSRGQGGEVRAFLDRSYKGTRVAKVRYYGSGASGPEFFYVSVDQGNRMMESINEGLQFFVEPLANGIFEVRNDRGDIHDVYDSGEEAVRVADQLNAQYGDIDEDVERIKKLAGLNEVKSGRFNSKMIGKRVKIIGQPSFDDGNDYTGEEGVVTRASREHTFSRMVPFVIEYGVDLDSGSRISIRREHVRKVKIQETASGGATGAGAIASSPTAVGGMQSRNRSIYGQTKLRKKPAPKKRPTREEKGDGIGRSKKD